MKKSIFAAMVALCLSAVAFAAPPPAADSAPVMAQAVATVEASQPVVMHECWDLGVASLQRIASERLQRIGGGSGDMDMIATLAPAVGHKTIESVQGRSRS